MGRSVVTVGILLVLLFSVDVVSAAPVESQHDEIKKWGRATIAGEVYAISKNILTISKGKKRYLVNILPLTRSHCRFGVPAKITDLSIGDRLNIVGDFINRDRTEINAIWIRDKSISKINQIDYSK